MTGLSRLRVRLVSRGGAAIALFVALSLLGGELAHSTIQRGEAYPKAGESYGASKSLTWAPLPALPEKIEVGKRSPWSVAFGVKLERKQAASIPLLAEFALLNAGGETIRSEKLALNFEKNASSLSGEIQGTGWPKEAVSWQVEIRRNDGVLPEYSPLLGARGAIEVEATGGALVTFEPSEITLAQREIATFEIKVDESAPGIDWNITSDLPWLRVFPRSGKGSGKVIVISDLSAALEGVSGEITLAAGGLESKIPVSAKPRARTITVTGRSGKSAKVQVAPHFTRILVRNPVTGTLDWRPLADEIKLEALLLYYMDGRRRVLFADHFDAFSKKPLSELADDVLGEALQEIAAQSKENALTRLEVTGSPEALAPDAAAPIVGTLIGISLDPPDGLDPWVPRFRLGEITPDDGDKLTKGKKARVAIAIEPPEGVAGIVPQLEKGRVKRHTIVITGPGREIIGTGEIDVEFGSSEEGAIEIDLNEKVAAGSFTFEVYHKTSKGKGLSDEDKLIGNAKKNVQGEPPPPPPPVKVSATVVTTQNPDGKGAKPEYTTEEIVGIRARVTNEGEGEISVRPHLEIGHPSEKGAAIFDRGADEESFKLAPGAEKTIEYAVGPGLEIGVYKAFFSVHDASDFDVVYSEWNKNRADVLFRVRDAGRSELKIAAIRAVTTGDAGDAAADRAELVAGRPVTIQVDLENAGAKPTGSFFVSYLLDGNLIKTIEVTDGVEKGATRALEFAAGDIFPAAGKYTIEIRIPGQGAVIEEESEGRGKGAKERGDLTATVEVDVLPRGADLAIEDARVVNPLDPAAKPEAGSPIVIVVDLANLGDAVSGDLTVKVEIDGTSRGEFAAAGLEAGGEATLELKLNEGVTDAGPHTVKVTVVDAAGEIITSNNEFVIGGADGVVDFEAKAADVGITSLEIVGEAGDGLVVSGTKMTIKAGLENSGGRSSGQFMVTTLIDGEAVGTPRSMEAIKAGESSEFSSVLTAPSAGEHTVKLRVEGVTGEKNSGNNERTLELDIVAPAADIEAGAIRVIPAGDEDGPLLANTMTNIQISLKNVGAAASGPFAVTYFVGDEKIGSENHGGLAAGAEGTTGFSSEAAFKSPGTYKVTVVVSNVAGERRAENNRSVMEGVIVESRGPDIVVKEIRTEGDTKVGVIKVVVVIENRGDQGATGVTVDIEAGGKTVTVGPVDIAAGEEKAVTGEIEITAPGSTEISVTVPAVDGERDVTDNTSKLVIEISGVPDMVLDAIRIEPETVKAGKAISISAVASNRGTADATGTLNSGLARRIQFSVDGVGVDPYAGQERVGTMVMVDWVLKPGEEFSEAVPYTFPSAGKYVVRAEVAGTSGEVISENNAIEREVEVLAAGPNVVVKDVKLTGDSAVTGLVGITVVVENQGDLGAGGVLIEIKVGDKTVTVGPVDLAAGEEKTVTGEIEITAPGSTEVSVTVPAVEGEPEDAMGDNTMTITITVEEPPQQIFDLTTTRVWTDATEAQVAGQEYTIFAEVTNLTGSDTTIMNAFDVNEVAVPMTAPVDISVGQSATIAVKYTFPSSGDYVIRFPATLFGDGNPENDVNLENGSPGAKIGVVAPPEIDYVLAHDGQATLPAGATQFTAGEVTTLHIGANAEINRQWRNGGDPYIDSIKVDVYVDEKLVGSSDISVVQGRSSYDFRYDYIFPSVATYKVRLVAKSGPAYSTDNGGNIIASSPTGIAETKLDNNVQEFEVTVLPAVTPPPVGQTTAPANCNFPGQFIPIVGAPAGISGEIAPWGCAVTADGGSADGNIQPLTWQLNWNQSGDPVGFDDDNAWGNDNWSAKWDALYGWEDGQLCLEIRNNRNWAGAASKKWIGYKVRLSQGEFEDGSTEKIFVLDQYVTDDGQQNVSKCLRIGVTALSDQLTFVAASKSGRTEQPELEFDGSTIYVPNSDEAPAFFGFAGRPFGSAASVTVEITFPDGSNASRNSEQVLLGYRQQSYQVWVDKVDDLQIVHCNLPSLGKTPWEYNYTGSAEKKAIEPGIYTLSFPQIGKSYKVRYGGEAQPDELGDWQNSGADPHNQYKNIGGPVYLPITVTGEVYVHSENSDAADKGWVFLSEGANYVDGNMNYLLARMAAISVGPDQSYEFDGYSRGDWGNNGALSPGKWTPFTVTLNEDGTFTHNAGEISLNQKVPAEQLSKLITKQWYVTLGSSTRIDEPNRIQFRGINVVGASQPPSEPVFWQTSGPDPHNQYKKAGGPLYLPVTVQGEVWIRSTADAERTFGGVIISDDATGNPHTLATKSVAALMTGHHPSGYIQGSFIGSERDVTGGGKMQAQVWTPFEVTMNADGSLTYGSPGNIRYTPTAEEKQAIAGVAEWHAYLSGSQISSDAGGVKFRGISVTGSDMPPVVEPPQLTVVCPKLLVAPQASYASMMDQVFFSQGSGSQGDPLIVPYTKPDQGAVIAGIMVCGKASGSISDAKVIDPDGREVTFGNVYESTDVYKNNFPHLADQFGGNSVLHFQWGYVGQSDGTIGQMTGGEPMKPGLYQFFAPGLGFGNGLWVKYEGPTPPPPTEGCGAPPIMSKPANADQAFWDAYRFAKAVELPNAPAGIKGTIEPYATDCDNSPTNGQEVYWQRHWPNVSFDNDFGFGDPWGAWDASVAWEGNTLKLKVDNLSHPAASEHTGYPDYYTIEIGYKVTLTEGTFEDGSNEKVFILTTYKKAGPSQTSISRDVKIVSSAAPSELGDWQNSGADPHNQYKNIGGPVYLPITVTGEVYVHSENSDAADKGWVFLSEGANYVDGNMNYLLARMAAISVGPDQSYEFDGYSRGDWGNNGALSPGKWTPFTVTLNEDGTFTHNAGEISLNQKIPVEQLSKLITKQWYVTLGSSTRIDEPNRIRFRGVNVVGASQPPSEPVFWQTSGPDPHNQYKKAGGPLYLPVTVQGEVWIRSVSDAERTFGGVVISDDATGNPHTLATKSIAALMTGHHPSGYIQGSLIGSERDVTGGGKMQAQVWTPFQVTMNIDGSLTYGSPGNISYTPTADEAQTIAGVAEWHAYLSGSQISTDAGGVKFRGISVSGGEKPVELHKDFNILRGTGGAPGDARYMGVFVNGVQKGLIPAITVNQGDEVKLEGSIHTLPAISPVPNVLFRLYMNGEVIKEVVAQSGSSWSAPEISASWNDARLFVLPKDLAPGTYEFRIVADPENIWPETDESDNEMTTTVTVVGDVDASISYPSDAFVTRQWYGGGNPDGVVADGGAPFIIPFGQFAQNVVFAAGASNTSDVVQITLPGGRTIEKSVGQAYWESPIRDAGRFMVHNQIGPVGSSFFIGNEEIFVLAGDYVFNFPDQPVALRVRFEENPKIIVVKPQPEGYSHPGAPPISQIVHSEGPYSLPITITGEVYAGDKTIARAGWVTLSPRVALPEELNGGDDAWIGASLLHSSPMNLPIGYKMPGSAATGASVDASWVYNSWMPFTLTVDAAGKITLTSVGKTVTAQIPPEELPKDLKWHAVFTAGYHQASSSTEAGHVRFRNIAVTSGGARTEAKVAAVSPSKMAMVTGGELSMSLTEKVVTLTGEGLDKVWRLGLAVPDWKIAVGDEGTADVVILYVGKTFEAAGSSNAAEYPFEWRIKGKTELVTPSEIKVTFETWDFKWLDPIFATPVRLKGKWNVLGQLDKGLGEFPVEIEYLPYAEDVIGGTWE